MSSSQHSTTTTTATSQAISIFPNNNQRQSQMHTQPSKPLPMVSGVDIDYDMTMSMSMGMNMGIGGMTGMGVPGDIDMHMGSLGVGGVASMNMGITGSTIDMDVISDHHHHQQQQQQYYSQQYQNEQHLMSWSPRPTNSFQNRFYPSASPGSLFNPIAMPAPNLSSPIPINNSSRKSSNTKSKPPHKPNSTNQQPSSSKRRQNITQPNPRRSRGERDVKTEMNQCSRGRKGNISPSRRHAKSEGKEVGEGSKGVGEGEDGEGEEDADGSADGSVDADADGDHDEDGDGDDGEEEDRDYDAYPYPNSLTLPSSAHEEAGNYTCCGVMLPDLHALVDHFESAHVQVVAASPPSLMGGLDGMSVHHPHQHSNTNGGAGGMAVSVSATNTPHLTSNATSTLTNATSTSSSSSTTSSSTAYEFPATPFDTDDMDISLSDDGGPSPSPPRTPGTSPSPTTSAFDPIRVVYHPSGMVGMGMSMGGVTGNGLMSNAYGISTLSTVGSAFSMAGGVGTHYLSPTTVSISSSSSSSSPSTSSTTQSHANGGGAVQPFFRASTYSSLAGGNGPTPHSSHSLSGQHAGQLTAAGAFNRYAGYAEYSSNLPGTDPSPTYHHPQHHVAKHGGVGGYGYTSATAGNAGTGMAGGNGNGGFFNNPAAGAPVSSCLPPALLFSSSAEPSPLNTPSSSRTGSPVSQHPSQSQSQGHVLPNGTLPLHPSSSSSASASSSVSTSIAPSRRTPPPSSLASTAAAASSSTSTTTSNSASSSSKPFKCPKPGCNKSYKQQNGLKYHLSHGQCNFAPRDPEVEKLSEMERERRIRPFVCKVPVAVPASSGAAAGIGGELGKTGCSSGPGVFVECGRRYKNMNGLRYHYQHTGEHGQIGLEMLAQGRHPLPDLPHQPNLISTSTAPSSPSMTSNTNTATTNTTTTPVLPTLNTCLSTASSAPLSPLSSPSHPSSPAGSILSVPPTPLTPLSPHPLRISTTTTSSSTPAASSVSMPPSPSRYAALAGALGGIAHGAGAISTTTATTTATTTDASGGGYPALGKSMSYPSSPVSMVSQNQTRMFQSPLLSSVSTTTSVVATATQHSDLPRPYSAFGQRYGGLGRV